MSKIFNVDTANSRTEIIVNDGVISQIRIVTSYHTPAVYKNPPQSKISEITTNMADFHNLLNVTALLKEIKDSELKENLKQIISKQLKEIEEIVKKA